MLISDGVIFVSIDDNEYPRLILLMEDIFGENNLKTICVKMSESSGLKMASVKKQGTIPKLKEYIVLAKKGGVTGLSMEKIPKDNWDDEYNTIISNTSEKEVCKIKSIQIDTARSNEDEKNLDKIISKWKISPLSKYFNENNINKSEQERFKQKNSWRIIRTAAMSGNSNKIAISKNKKFKRKFVFFSIITPRKKICIVKSFKETSRKPRSEVLFASDHLDVHPGDLWTDIKTTGLDSEGGVSFKNGKKPLSLIKRIIKMNSRKNIIVLDFFAGSGTVGEAVLEVNKEDKGIRKFILCTNNEDKICTDITYPRIKNVLRGYNTKKPLDGILRYFKTDFIAYKNKATDSVKSKLMKNATEMICLKEDSFEKIKDKKGFKIFKGRRVFLGILFEEGEIDKFKEEIKKINKYTAVYVFALFGLDQYENRFSKLKNVKIVSVPEAIMKVYKRLFFGLKD